MKRKELQYQTVKPILRSTLERLMEIDEFKPFRLVGGTSLSLRFITKILFYVCLNIVFKWRLRF